MGTDGLGWNFAGVVLDGVGILLGGCRWRPTGDSFNGSDTYAWVLGLGYGAEVEDARSFFVYVLCNGAYYSSRETVLDLFGAWGSLGWGGFWLIYRRRTARSCYV